MFPEAYYGLLAPRVIAPLTVAEGVVRSLCFGSCEPHAFACVLFTLPNDVRLGSSGFSPHSRSRGLSLLLAHLLKPRLHTLKIFPRTSPDQFFTCLILHSFRPEVSVAVMRRLHEDENIVKSSYPQGVVLHVSSFMLHVTKRKRPLRWGRRVRTTGWPCFVNGGFSKK